MAPLLLLLLAFGQDGSPAELLERARRGEMPERERTGERVGAFEASPVRVRSLDVDARRRDYEIRVDGSADARNTLTRSHDGFRIAFQPNLSLAISNTGDRPVRNPRVVVNGERRWWSLETMLEEVLAGAKDDREKALRIWDFVRSRRHHDLPLFAGDELHDPVKMLNAYGGGLCDDSAEVGSSLLFHAGLRGPGTGERPRIRSLHGHVMVEAYWDGAHRFLDIDQDVFYLDRENESIVGGDEVARDHDLARREHTYGPVFRGWETGGRAAALFGRDDRARFRAVAGHRIDLTLRTGETIVYRWDHDGKIATSGPARRSFWATSQLVYAPPLGADAASPRVYEMAGPYPVCGGRVQAGFRGPERGDRFTVETSLDGKSWREVWSRTGAGELRCDVALDDALEVSRGPAKYRYFVRVGGSPTDLVLRTDLMASPHALPALGLGLNRIVYTDETDEPHAVRITHRWRESGNVLPPAPPAEPVFPAPGAELRASTVAFRWPRVTGADAYHLQVSLAPDMRLPYRPSFDLVVPEPGLHSPFTGLFSPDTDYYWRVRPRGKEGLWGPWSEVWRFRWDGPRVPVALETRHAEPGRILLSWKPNPRGPRPASYRIYGSDERGFAVSDVPYALEGLGPQGPNLLGETAGTELTVVSAEGDHPVLNRCYYRVVAVDRHGTRSGPSDYVELPHPHVYTVPPATAAVGRPFRYAPRTIRSLGDLQCRYAEPRRAYWEREEYSFTLARGPGWLSVDEATGVVQGTPGADDAGDADVEITVTRRFPHEAAPTGRDRGIFEKSDERFQASHAHRFRLNVRKEPR